MTVRTSRFGFGFDPSVAQRETAQVPIPPARGFHGGRRYTDLEPGFTPESKNFAVDRTSILPRSGLSQFNGDTSLNTVVRGGQEAFNAQGKVFSVAVSDRTLSFLPSDDPSWRTAAFETTPTMTPDEQWDTTVIYDDDNTQNILVLTNGRDLPSFMTLNTSTEHVSDFTNVASFLSRARSVEAFDNRLVWFNIRESDTDRVSRVAWSQRGKPQSYDNVGTEAGFEDLFDMSGEGVSMVRSQGRLVLFGDQEIWQARPRRDTFAFDFVASLREVGAPFPDTAKRTPVGVIFLAQDLELYLLSGSNLRPLGPVQDGGESRVQNKLQTELKSGENAFAVYDQTKKSYNLYYPTTEGAHPDKSLSYSITNRTFTFHEYPVELTHGYDATDPGVVSDPSAWDDVTETWDDIATAWDDFGIQRPPIEDRHVVAFSSNATPYRFRSDQTTDDGTEIDARWRSHGLKISDNARFNYLDALEIDFESNSASSLTVAISDDGFVSDLDEIELSVASSNQSVAYAPVRVTARAPQFELRTDGSGPQINRMWASVRRAGRF